MKERLLAMINGNSSQYGQRKRPAEDNFLSSLAKRNGPVKHVGQSEHLGLVEKLVQVDAFISAQSSSIHKDDYSNWGPQLAWKGQSTKHVGFFNSKMEAKPWLKVYIKPHEISSVTIVNRKDCNGERLRNVEVRVGLSPNLPDEVVGTFQGPGVTGGEHVIQFKKTVFVGFIIFQIMERGILHINGIRVNEKSPVAIRAYHQQTFQYPQSPPKRHQPFSYHQQPHSSSLRIPLHPVPCVSQQPVESVQQNATGHLYSEPRNQVGIGGYPVCANPPYNSVILPQDSSRNPGDNYESYLSYNPNDADTISSPRILPRLCACGCRATKGCSKKSCFMCCNQSCEKHATMCLCGHAPQKNCSKRRCTKCCDDQACPKHRHRCLCGNIATKGCIRNVCPKCCDDKLCKKHGNKCLCGNGALKTCTQKSCGKCCNDRSCEMHRNVCSCGAAAIKECTKKRCHNCCVDRTCQKHGKRCSCGHVATKKCTKNCCPKCCSDGSCPKHMNLCSCRKNAATKGCTKKQCYKCCKQSCPKHAGSCLCGNVATKDCTTTSCSKCCAEESCPRHGNRCLCGNNATKECPDKSCGKCCLNQACDRHGERCSCGIVATKRCTKQSCANCCDDISCKKHGNLCVCGNPVSKECTRKRCGICCIKSCQKHDIMCFCGSIATKDCTQKRCSTCCDDELCQKNGKKHGKGSGRVTEDLKPEEVAPSARGTCDPGVVSFAPRLTEAVHDENTNDVSKGSSHKFYVQYPSAQMYNEKHIQRIFKPYCDLKCIEKIDERSACAILQDSVTSKTFENIFLELVMKSYRKNTNSIYITLYSKFLEMSKSDQPIETNNHGMQISESDQPGMTNINTIQTSNSDKPAETNINVTQVIKSEEPVETNVNAMQTIKLENPVETDIYDMQNSDSNIGGDEECRTVRVVQDLHPDELAPSAHLTCDPGALPAFGSPLTDVQVISTNDIYKENSHKFYVQFPLVQTYNEKHLERLFKPYCDLKHIERIDERSACVTLQDDATFKTHERIYLDLVMKSNRENSNSIYITLYSKFLETRTSEKPVETDINAMQTVKFKKPVETNINAMQMNRSDQPVNRNINAAQTSKSANPVEINPNVMQNSDAIIPGDVECKIEEEEEESEEDDVNGWW